MSLKTALVVTTINSPNDVLKALADGSVRNGWEFIVAGDSKTPEFDLPGCRFLSLSEQRSGSQLGASCPERTYARKNLGYLAAMVSGADVIVETDDDNMPLPEFWSPRDSTQYCRQVDSDGWVNAYVYFTDKPIYPRGLPLVSARTAAPDAPHLIWAECPIQQGLANGDPDVDAIYRMMFDLPFDFNSGHDPVFFEEGAWCPFNSQNTTWFKEAFPLMYLPASCSFRMCDIWRSFVAQRIMPGIMFHGPTVYQDRNEHDLHRDFADEVPGYLHNSDIRKTLMALKFPANASIYDKLEYCYRTMVDRGWIRSWEMSLVRSWVQACQSIIG